MKSCVPLSTVRGARRRFQHSLVSLEIPDLWLRSEAVNSLTWSWQRALRTLADFWADWKSRVSAGTKRKEKKKNITAWFSCLKEDEVMQEAVGKPTVREPCKCLQATFKHKSNYHANNTRHTRLWAGNKGVKKAPTRETSYETLLEAGGFLCGSHSRRSGVPKFEDLVITGYSSNNDDEAFADFGKSRSSNLLIPHLGSLSLQALTYGIECQQFIPLLHKNKNVSSVGWRKKIYLDANKTLSSSCVCCRMVQLSGVKNLPSAGQSIFTRASTGWTNFLRAPPFLDISWSRQETDRKRHKVAQLFASRDRQNHNCSPSAAQTLQKPVLHIKPPTRSSVINVLLQKYFFFLKTWSGQNVFFSLLLCRFPWKRAFHRKQHKTITK